MIAVFRRFAVLGAVLTLTALLVPNSSLISTEASLVRSETARGMDHSQDTIWILLLGSDARPGENPLRSRADAIQMVGLNQETHKAVTIGIPRDSWVSIDGVGFSRINAALYYGGPQLMGKTVGDLVGVQPDYVFTATFSGFRTMINAIGGITVDSRLAFTDDNMIGDIKVGENKLYGGGALFFSRARHFLPRGDFDRSANQQLTLAAILRQVTSHQSVPGFMERSVLYALRNLYTDLSPLEMYRLAQAATSIDPKQFKGCLVEGSIGDVNGASVVFPDTALAARLGAEAKDDATFNGDC